MTGIRIGKYAIELLILIAGIMISFLLNEWRVSNQQKEEKNRIVNQFIDDLKADTLQIKEHSSIIERVTLSCQSLMVNDSMIDLAETSTNVAMMLNTVSDKFNEAAYIEASSTGKIGLIENHDLRYRLITMYDQSHPEIYGWHEVDMKENFPALTRYVNANVPFSPQLNFTTLTAAKQEQLASAILTDEFKNLVQMNLIIKSGTGQLYGMKKEECIALIALLEEELE